MCVYLYIYIYIYIINIYSTHTYIMQTKTFNLCVINHDELFDSTNIYIYIYIYIYIKRLLFFLADVQ